MTRQKISTDAAKIDELLTRSIDRIYPDKENLRKLLLSGKQLSLYVGIDPTADYVHLGHSTNYLLLERFHELGHKVIVLVGDFTAMIGDPSDKTAARVRLAPQEIKKNLKTFKEQIGKILNFKDKKNKIEFKFNSSWLKKLDFEKLVDLASNFTVQQMLERDMFEKRIKENKPLYVHEFFYPLMQGYDSVALGVDLEVGGTDQTFNMLAGRTLVRRYLDREKFVISTTLLVNPITGEKLMSKSLGTGVGLNESAENMFGKVMALADEGVIQTFIDCTRIPLSDIQKKKERLTAGENPKNVKMELAKEIVRMYHGDEAAEEAERYFVSTFQKKETPNEIAEFAVAGKNIVDVLFETKLSESKSEARRLITEKGIKINGLVVSSPDTLVKSGDVIQKGKRFFAKAK